jgi:hypothetical protein
MNQKRSDNLSKGDIISFIALLVMGILVFFGMNFKTLGDKIPSMLVAIILVMVMTTFVFLAAHAKAQNHNQSMWRNVEISMIFLYVLSLIPCYVYTSKFFSIYFNKSEITQQVESDVDNINKMFADYNRVCESRCVSYQTALEAMSKDAQGRAQIANLLEIKVKDITQQSITQAASSFSNTLRGGEYQALETEKEALEANLQVNIKNWNILYIPQYAAEIGAAKEKYAKELNAIYSKYQNNIEHNIPSFNAEKYIAQDSLKETFTGGVGFSFGGILAIIILGGLGLVKYLLGEKRTVIEMRGGSSENITNNGGFTIG